MKQFNFLHGERVASLKEGAAPRQDNLFQNDTPESKPTPDNTSTFIKNMSLPVHRWFRFSAGFSAEWVESTIKEAYRDGPVRVFDPFAGSGTTLVAAETTGVESWGIEAHPFIARVGRAKLFWRTDPRAYLKKIQEVQHVIHDLKPKAADYPELIQKCYEKDTLDRLDLLRQAYELVRDDTPASQLLWLTLVSILRKVANVGTAPWQYILPKKTSKAYDVREAFEACSRMIYQDMLLGQMMRGPRASLIQSDARTCEGVPKDFANLVITSPPYANNYDYADATRLEMSFMREIDGWGDLQEKVRKYLIRSCSQHVPESSVDLQAVLSAPELAPVRDELSNTCNELAEIRKTKGGKKTYHLMVACYFRDLAQTWIALRSVCSFPSNICFVIGDSAPYGVYVPTVPWLGRLAIAAGFKSFKFEKTRDRNVKWKNRKHRVPLQEGRLLVQG